MIKLYKDLLIYYISSPITKLIYNYVKTKPIESY